MDISTLFSLKNEQSELKVDLNGGRIVELKLKNRLILGAYDRLDGKKGSTHLCLPNFQDEGENFGLPFHGPARNSLWTLVSSPPNSLEIEYLLKDFANYPANLKTTQIFTLSPSWFSQSILIENIGTKTAPLNLAAHYYWDTPNSWKGLLINNQKTTEKVIDNGIVELKDKNEIVFPGQKPIILQQQGFAMAKLWTTATPDKKQFDHSFVCIEPLRGIDRFFGSAESLLQPKQKLTADLKISLL